MQSAVAWKAKTEIECVKLIEIIDAQFPDDSDGIISERAGMHVDSVRNIRRRSREGKLVKIETADKLLIGLDLKDESSRLIDEAWGEQPKWHKDWPHCQKCLRINVTYMARGLCSTCYRKRDDQTYLPPCELPWSMRYPHCQSCERTDRPHAGRGLCGTCWQRKRKSGELIPATSGRGANRRSSE
jgi:hypothetical protein